MTQRKVFLPTAVSSSRAVLGELVSRWKNSGGLHLWGWPRQSAQHSAPSPESITPRHAAASGFMAYCCFIATVWERRGHRAASPGCRQEGAAARRVSRCGITRTHTCTNDRIRKRRSQRILAILQVLILPRSFFISFLNPFAEYKGILKSQFAQEVPNIELNSLQESARLSLWDLRGHHVSLECNICCSLGK